jgi:hypothetical protein
MGRSPTFWQLSDFEPDDDGDFDPPFARRVEGRPPAAPKEAPQATTPAGWSIVDEATQEGEPDCDPEDTQPVDVSKFRKEQP